MKHLNTVLLALLFLAVACIYYLHFSSSNNKSHKPEIANFGTAKTGSVAYVNMDSLMAKMEMSKDIQAGLARKQQNLESNFAVKYKSFQTNVSEAQKRLSDPTAVITSIQKDQIDQQLTKQRTELEKLQNDYMTQLQQEGVTANRRVIEYIMEYLKEYTKGKSIQYILSYSFGGNILFSDKELEITSEVLIGLNDQYRKEKSLQK
jgi:outer membrane protein